MKVKIGVAGDPERLHLTERNLSVMPRKGDVVMLPGFTDRVLVVRSVVWDLLNEQPEVYIMLENRSDEKKSRLSD